MVQEVGTDGIQSQLLKASTGLIFGGWKSRGIFSPEILGYCHGHGVMKKPAQSVIG